jgi:hypothetical protein
MGEGKANPCLQSAEVWELNSEGSWEWGQLLGWSQLSWVSMA